MPSIMPNNGGGEEREGKGKGGEGKGEENGFLTGTVEGPRQFSHHNFYDETNTKSQHLVKQGRFGPHKDTKVN